MKIPLSLITSSLSTALAILCLTPAALGNTYVFTDLGTLGGTSSGARAINGSGTVVGSAYDAAGNYHAVVFSQGALSDLGTLGGANSSANAINQNGQIVGFANPAGSTAQRAFLRSQGTMTDLGALLAGSASSLANGINGSGTVVGEYHTAAGQQRPFVYANGIAQDLGFNGVANCISDSGQIGGFEQSAGGNLGFILSGGKRQYVGTLGGNDTEVGKINNSGVAVGNSMTSQGTYHAFVYQNGFIRDLGTLGGASSEAYGLNSFGDIVGEAKDAQGSFRAYVYRGGVMTDLNALLAPGSAWFLTIAYGINDAGQIVGSGQINGQTHGFLLTPSPGLTGNMVLSLDGNGAYATIPSAVDLQNPTAITIEGWIYPTQASSDQLGSFINKSDGLTATSQRTYEIRWLPSNVLTVNFFLTHVDGLPDAAGISAPVIANQWTHFAATFNSANGQAQIFTNGVLCGGLSNIAVYSRPLRQTSLPLVLGSTPGFNNDYASGLIDEIRIWEKSRSGQEIAESMFCRLTGTEQGLAAYWNFDTGRPNDLTGNGHDATLVGNAQIQPLQGVDLIHQGVCGPTPTTPSRARATATITSGFLTGIILTDHGSGYTNTPNVTIIGDGTGAKAVAVVENGSVSSIIILSSGSGFTTPPSIFIDPPITNPSITIAVSSVAVTMNIVAGRRYQLDSSFDCESWQQAGAEFTADADSITRVFEVGTTGHFFRVREIR